MPLIAFTSPKGGVGKTTLAAHVATILAQRRFKVLAIDLDPQNALRLHLGLSIHDETGFMAELSRHKADWRDQSRATASGVSVLPYGTLDPRRSMELNSALLVGPEMLAGPMREMLADEALVVIVDTPPGPSPATSAVLPHATLTIVVLLADAGSAPLIPQVIDGQPVVILNQIDLDCGLSSTVTNRALRALGTKLIGAICRDDALAEALAGNRLLNAGEGGAADDLQALADSIVARAGLALPAARRDAFPALADWGLAE